MSDEEEEYNYEDQDNMEEDADGDEEDEEMDADQDQDQEQEDAEEDEEEGSDSSGEGSDAGESDENSEDEDEDGMDEEEPVIRPDTMPTKSLKGIKRETTKSRATSLQPERSASPATIRRQLLRIPPPPCRSYAIEPVCAIPHPSPTNAMAASLCFTHLMTGSDDGFIRDYDIFSAVNGRTFLTAPQRSHCGLGDTMMKAGLLRCWWPATTQEKYDAGETSPVCSMACHSDALWALSGNANGEVHLYTVRHEPGRLHYTFSEHDAAVTALGLSSDEKFAFSGSHDGSALQLDLDRGTVARRFDHPGAQITAIGLRPYFPFTLPESNIIVATDSPAPMTGEEPKSTVAEDLLGGSQVTTGEQPPSSPPDTEEKEAYDPLFDDVEGGSGSAVPSPKSIQPTSGNTPGLSLPGSRPAAADVLLSPQSAPLLKHGVSRLDPVKYADFSDDLLMTATFGGSLFLWDRRTPKNVGRLENDKTPPWCISACWSATGNEILAGRRNATVDVFDVRQFGGSSFQNPRVLRTLVNPADSKTVTCVAAFPDGKHMVCASEDNIRLWNVLDAPAEGWKRKGLPPFRVIPGHHGGLVSQILIDVRSQFMVTASSARQWPGQSTKTVLVHDIRPVI